MVGAEMLAGAAALFNPFALSPLMWWCSYAVMRFLLFITIDGIVWVIGPRVTNPLPSRTDKTRPPYKHVLDRYDVIYLGINSFIEYAFLQQLAWFLWFHPRVLRSGGDFGLASGPLAWYLLFVVDDMLYAPAHRFMHWPPVYKYVHKHHHRNTFPSRGYIDGANEHPCEQLLALSLHWTAMHIVMRATGLHASAVVLHIALKALGACFNHTGFDLRFQFLGIDYSVGAHEMHHRRPNTNYAQYVMFWDRLMGTYVEYQSTGEKAR